MATSRRLKDLNREIETLRNHFLPTPFDPLGQYADAGRIQANTRAFLILSHAEIEWYIEEWARDIARTCEAKWNSTNKVTMPLAFLVSTVAEKIAVPATFGNPTSWDGPTELADTVTKLFPRYYKKINDNHGIREGNLISLLAPLGIAAAAVGATLVPNLEDLGKKRGIHAHQSAKAVPNPPDPETEYKRVTTVLADLAVLDTWLMNYKRRIR